MKARLTILILSGALVLLILSGVGWNPFKAGAETYSFLRTFVEILDLIREEYVEQVGTEDLMQGALQGLAEGLDAGSGYLDPPTFEKWLEYQEGSMGWCGLVVGRNRPLSYVQVLGVEPGSSAEEQGILPGDFVKLLAGEHSVALSGPRIDLALHGGVGESLKVVVIAADGSGERALDLEYRKLVTSPDKFVQVEDLDRSNTAHIQISRMVEGMAKFVTETELPALKSRGIQDLVLDLRGCTGDSLTDAVELVDAFQSEGIIVTVSGQTREDLIYRASPGNTLFQGRVVVLADSLTAGASEIVAGALQSSGRSALFGERTFGRGTVQELIRLPRGGAILLSVARFLLADGRIIEDFPDPTEERLEAFFGVEPDEEVSPESDESDVDAVLERAVLFLDQDETDVIARTGNSEQEAA